MKLIVNPHTIEIKKELVNEKEIDITKCEFEFSDEITDDYVKEAYFTYNGTTYKQIIQDNQCKIPYEVLDKPSMIELGVVAYKLENDEYVKRYNPSPAYFNSIVGSLKDEYENTEPITPTDKEQIEQLVTNALDEANTAVENANTALNQANNLDLDVSKEDKTATVSITKKDGTQKSVNIFDGVSLQFIWQGTSLGVKTDDMQDYVFVDLQGIQGQPGPQGEAFQIKKTYATTQLMIADYDNMNINDYVMISGDIETQDNATLWVKTETEDPTYRWVYLADFSGASGIQGETGATPIISIGNVVSGDTPSVTISGTAERPIFNFTLVKGDKGDTGNTGQTGATGNGIFNIEKTNETPSQSDYRINYTNGGYFDYSVLNGEVTKSQLEMLENALPHVSGTGTSITLNNTAQYPMKNVLNPSELSQETTTGKNKLNGASPTDYNLATSSFNNEIITVSSTATTTTPYARWVIEGLNTNDVIRYSTIIQNSNGQAVLQYDNNGSWVTITTSVKQYTDGTTPTTFAWTNSVGTTKVRFLLYADKAIPTGPSTSSYKEAIVTINNDNMSYEKYSGGIAQPNPTYPSDVRVITGDNLVYIQNENLIIETLTETNINSYGTISSGSGVQYEVHIAPIFKGVEYRLSTNDTSGMVAAYYYTKPVNGSISYDGKRVISYSDRTFTAPITGYIAYRSLPNYTTAMVNKGTTAITYKTPEFIQKTLTLGTLEYCKIGTYSDHFFKAIDGDSIYDTLDDTTKASLTSGKWYIQKNIGKAVLDGSETWNLQNVTSGKNYYTNLASVGVLGNVSVPIYSNISKYRYFLSSAQDVPEYSSYISAGKNLNYLANEFDDTSALKTFLNTTNMIVYCVLANPTYTLLNDTLQQQLDDIYNTMLSYQGQTNISQVNNDLPFAITSNALRDMSDIYNL